MVAMTVINAIAQAMNEGRTGDVAVLVDDDVHDHVAVAA
jgi:hypothetical protein